jgi:hypothetical protein
MLYAILCYDNEEVVTSWNQEQEAAVMARLDAVTRRLASEGRLGPVARLMPTTTASTVRKGAKPLVLDGPFAETKEQLLGFYVVDCDSLEQAIDIGRELGIASGLSGAHEVRPLMLYRPGSAGS